MSQGSIRKGTGVHLAVGEYGSISECMYALERRRRVCLRLRGVGKGERHDDKALMLENKREGNEQLEGCEL